MRIGEEVMKMSEKKRWFSEICEDLQDKRLKKVDISWTSSDSEDEKTYENPLEKRLKVDKDSSCKSKTSSWINVIADESITPSKNNNLNFHIESPKISRTLTSSCSKNDFLGSPIISGSKLEKSPALIDDMISSPHEKSPIISNRNMLKKIKWRCKLKIEEKLTLCIQDDSPNSPLTQANIVEVDSQPTPIKISPAKSETPPSCKIDPCSSQNSSEIISGSSTNSSDFKSLYHEPPPRRKKYKKGGLANQLQRALDTQSTSLAIWQHEMYLNKLKKEEIPPCSIEEIKFKLIDKWKDYGCNVLECELVNEEDSCKVPEPLAHLQSENKVFLIITPANIGINVCFESNRYYKLFPPYAIESVKHKQKDTFCLVNASRFVQSN